MPTILSSIDVKGTSGYTLRGEDLDDTAKFIVVGPAGKRHAVVPADWSEIPNLITWLQERYAAHA